MRLRLLPFVVAAFSAALMMKAGGLWLDLDLANPLVAEEADGTRDAAHPARPARPQLSTLERDLAPTAGDSDKEGSTASDDSPAEGDPPAEAPDAGREKPSFVVKDPFDLSDEEIEVLQQLVARREELERRAHEMDQQAALLEAAEGRIEDKIKELEALQAIIEGLLIKHDEQEEAQLQSLVKIYSNMKPKEAARIFEELDMVVLLDVIGRMKERKSAPILAKMNPAKAKAITLELAQRRELPIARN